MIGKTITVWWKHGPIEAQVVEVYGDGNIKVVTVNVIGKSNVFIARPETETKYHLHRSLE